MANKANLDQSIKKVSDWAEIMQEKGIYNAGTSKNRISALKKITSILGNDEPADPESILKNIEVIAKRWARKNTIAPDSARIYQSHLKSLLSDYMEYQKNPSTFKAGGSQPRSRIEKGKVVKKKERKVKLLKVKGSEVEETNHLKKNTMPTIHFNIQIHISPDASETQIDKVFESIAKNLHI
jgi:hypothetical protein